MARANTAPGGLPLMMGLSPLELGVILVVIILLFGARRLPELGSGLGQAIGNFKKAFRDSTAIDVTPEKKGDEKKIEEKK